VTLHPTVCGIGVASAAGFGKASLQKALFESCNVFTELQRPGRQAPGQQSPFIGAELPEPPQILPARIARQTGLTGAVAIAVLDEAWQEAELACLNPQRIGLVIGGSNLQAREHMLMQQTYAQRPHFLPPRYGYSFFDTDLCALCTSTYAIRGFSYTVGGASASGAMAVLHAMDAVRSGRVDACIALGALQDLSYFECQALISMGAMGGAHSSPERSCRPFDLDRSGFIFGESCAAIVIRRSDMSELGRNYGSLIGGAHIANGQRGPEPSLEGEVRAMRLALDDARITAADIDYVNTHGTGTPLGDDTEVAALRAVGLEHAALNATKSIIGHGLSAAGAMELAAVLLQMQDGRLHPTRNLDQPIDPALNWIRGIPRLHKFAYALSLSFGFGGIDTALVVQAPDAL